jgi:hypothetical protein
LSLSGRKDGANLFGIRSNQRITPLWSAGLSWDISKEPFYRIPFLSSLRLKATHGYNGNTFNATAFMVARYYSSSLTGIQNAAVTTPANPDLQWEKVATTNLALEFALRNDRITGSFEWFSKKGMDLIEDQPLAPSTGFTTVKGNAASTLTQGVDIVLNSRNLDAPLSWNTTLMFSTARDRVLKFDKAYTATQLGSATGGLVAVEGRSIFGVFSYPFSGIDPANGDPMGIYQGKPSKDYLNIIQRTITDSLVYHGSARPTIFGALRNRFAWKGFSVSFNITWKLGYYFRRNSTSLNYADIVLQSQNLDYLDRWQQPGDEKRSQVPSLVYPSNTNRNNFYRYSEALVEKGDHIRLQDIQLSYDWSPRSKERTWVRSVHLYLYLNNLGLIWRANKYGIDPDFNDNNFSFNLPEPKSLALGCRVSF